MDFFRAQGFWCKNSYKIPMTSLAKVLQIFILSLTIYQPAFASAQILYPFGEKVGDTIIRKSDEAVSSPVFLQPAFPFFDNSQTKLYVDVNGRITFSSLGSFDYQDKYAPMILAYYADTNTKIGGQVSYREITIANSKEILERATNEIRGASLLSRDFQATWGFVATWKDVAFYGANHDGRKRRNSFQVVLVRDGTAKKSFAILNYEKLQWTSGTLQGGGKYTGLRGGQPAVAKISSGSDSFFYELPGSRSEDVLDLVEFSNCDVEGKWIYELSASFFLIPKLSVSPSVSAFNETLVIANTEIGIRCSNDGEIVCDDIEDFQNISQSHWIGKLDRGQKTSCSCLFAKHENTETVTIAAAHGPEKVDIEVDVNKTYNLCNEDVVVRCTVEDVYPSVKMQLVILGTIFREINEVTSSGSFSFRKNFGGPFTAHCRAINFALNHRKESKMVTISPLSPPKRYPTLYIQAEESYSYDNLFNLVEGESVKVLCNIEGGYPATTEAYIECAGFPVVNNMFVFYRNMTSQSCTCRGEHASGCYDKQTNATIHVEHAPEKPNVTLLYEEPSYILCPQNYLSARMNVECLSTSEDRDPGFYIYVSPRPKDNDEFYDCDGEGVCRYLFEPRTGGLHSITCSAHNGYYRHLSIESDPLQVYVIQASSNNPVLSINGKEFSGSANAMTVVEGDTYTLQCRVDGGFPNTTNTSIECAGIALTKDTFVFSREMSFEHCKCRGEHESGCYNLETSVRLSVVLSCATKSHVDELKMDMKDLKIDHMGAKIAKMETEMTEMKTDMKMVLELLRQLKHSSERHGFRGKTKDGRSSHVTTSPASSPARRVWDIFRFLDTPTGQESQDPRE